MFLEYIGLFKIIGMEDEYIKVGDFLWIGGELRKIKYELRIVVLVLI